MQITLQFPFISTVTTLSNSLFTISALDRLEAMTGISIYNQLAPRYFTMVVKLLHLDHSIHNKLKRKNNPLDGSKAIFKAWFSGESTLPPTWKILLQILQALQMRELAQKIQYFFDRTLDSSSSAAQVKHLLCTSALCD